MLPGLIENVRAHVSRARSSLDDLARRVRIHEQYHSVFSTADGEDVLRHILRLGHTHESTFVRGDVHETLLREGERRLALSILRAYKRDTTELIKQIEDGIETS